MSSIPQSRPSIAPPRRPSPLLIAWGSVVLVVVVIVVLVVARVTSGPGPSSSTHQAVVVASPTLVHEIASVPASVFDQVGVGIPSQFAGDAPIVISGQPPLSLDGRSPSVLYLGAEYCPYCAAQRWGMAVALARFGSWRGLDTTASGLLDGDYSTLSFRRATLVSPTVHFVPVETCTNVVDPNATGCAGYRPLRRPTEAEQAVLATYAGPPFVPGRGGISFPFIDVDNKVLFSGSSYLPAVLTGLTQDQIARGLTDPTNPVTRSIIGTANIITAAVCAGTHGDPSAVCASAGVRAADAMLGQQASGGTR